MSDDPFDGAACTNSARELKATSPGLHTGIYIYIYIYILRTGQFASRVGKGRGCVLVCHTLLSYSTHFYKVTQ